MILSLYAIFFLSGIAALLFETLWFHQAGLTLGNSIWASSLVLAGFMGGLALGNALISCIGGRIRRPVRMYALFELIIGMTGVALVALLPRMAPTLAPVLRPFLDQPWILNPLRFAVAFPLLLIPTTAMGATLPLLTSALFRLDPRFGRVLGRLYGWNTLGAMIGALVGEIILIGRFGIRGTALIAALLNLIAAAVSFSLAELPAVATEPASDERSARTVRFSKSLVSLLAAAFLFGAVLLALEVIWFRLLNLFVYGSSVTFAIMLSVILAGIGLGGLVASRLLARRPEAYQDLPLISLWSGSVCIASYLLLDLSLQPFRGLSAVMWYEILSHAFTLMFPAALLSGILFTFVGEAINRQTAHVSRSAGLLTLANTIGGTLGSLAGAFLLLPVIGMEQSIRWLAGVYGLAALILVAGDAAGRTPKRSNMLFYASLGILLVVFVGFPSGYLRRRYLFSGMDNLVQEKPIPAEVRESLTETIVYLQYDWLGEPLYYRLVTNNHSMSSTQLRGLRYMKLFVYLPIALHPAPRRALLISYGVGSTAKALTDTAELESIDMVDISKDILEMNRIVFPDPRQNPLHDPRVRVHIEDGRYFLQTTDRRYDLITGEPPPPKHAGIVNLYTEEYFRLIRERLTEGGMTTYWLPTHMLFEQDTKAIIRAFCDVFEDCSLWHGAGLDWILLGTRGAQGPVSEERFTQQWRDHVVGPEIRALGFESPGQLGAAFMAGPENLHDMTRTTPPVTDNYPRRLSAMHPYDLGRIVHQPWLDVYIARERFLRSQFIQHLWPESQRLATLPWFDVQDTINRCFFGELDNVWVRLSLLHPILTRTSLRTLPLWLMRSDLNFQRAAAAAAAKGVKDPFLDYQFGVRALAERDYAAAAACFGASWKQASDKVEFLAYQIYALCLDGRLEEARQLLAQLNLNTHREVDQRFAQFLSETFGLDISISAIHQ